MDSQTKRTLIATLACLALLLGWFKLQEVWYPPPAPPTSAPGSSVDAPLSATEPSLVEGPSPRAGGAGPGLSAEFVAIGAASQQAPVVLGDDTQTPSNPFEFAATVSPRGASIEFLRMSRFRNHVATDRKNPGQDPYDLLVAVDDPAKGLHLASFATQRILLVDENQPVELGDVNWNLEKSSDASGDACVLRVQIRRADQPIVAIRKTFRVNRGSDHLAGDLTIENLSSQPRRVVVTQRGPIGLKNEDPQRESRRIASARVSWQTDEKGNPRLDASGRPLISVLPGDYAMRADIAKLPEAAMELRPGEHRLYWTAVGNKYFGCIETWLPIEGSPMPYADYVAKVVGRTYLHDPELASDLSRLSDLTTEQSLSPPAPIPPGKSVVMRFEAFCGPKSDAAFARHAPGLRQRRYDLIIAADRKGGCTFDVITDAMLWLLSMLHRVVGNYGVAIIIMVIIVRLILHPLTKTSQIRMMRMQKGMAALKPKLDAIQAQFKNDRQKLNEETMKLYREEHINPASSMLGCLPMVLQMPIWVALWTSLNTNVDLRHQPFILWIHDLSLPDSLVSFKTAVNIPLLGLVTGPIHGFNVLPIIMAATMYAQQKLMQKLTKPATPPAPKLDDQGRPLPDQLAQQQKIMNFMMIFFGAMLYNQPAGLNLYIFCSSLLGMLEQWQIKKHLKSIEQRGEGVVARKAETRGPSLLERLQKRAEDIRRAQESGELRKMKKRKAPRF
jgi:YidC/Oxa1 family membrane protein insertase